MMYFTGRKPGVAEPNAGGAIGLATSPDLYAGRSQPPVYAGGTFGQMEVPQVFEAGGRWYCLFCTDARHYSRAYRASYPGRAGAGHALHGGGRSAGAVGGGAGPFLDGDPAVNRYAARIVETDEGLRLLGFLHNPGGGDFVGEITDPVPVTIDGDGWLKLG